MAQPDTKAEAKALGDVLSAARKAPHNFVALITKGDVVFKADRRKPISTLRKSAKSDGGGTQGGWGLMRVSGKVITLECESEPPTTLAKLVKKHFAGLGHAVQVEIILAGGDADPADPKPELPASSKVQPPEGATKTIPASDKASQKRATKDSNSQSAAPDKAQSSKGAAGSQPPDTETALSAGTEDSDDEPPSENLKEILTKVRKRPHFFAWLYGKDELILKAHHRQKPEILLRLAKADGARPKGAWGQMIVDGKDLVLTVNEDPPGDFAKRAKQMLREHGQQYRIVLNSPSGTTIEEPDLPPETAQATDDPLQDMRADLSRFTGPIATFREGDKSGLSKKLDYLLASLAQAIEAGDAAKAAKVSSMISRELAKAGIAVPDPIRAPETEALFNTLDPASKRDLMEKVDEQFFARTDFPKGKKIPSKDHPMAAKWSAIRDEVIAEMVIPQGSDRPKPKTTTDLPLPIGYVPQHEREVDELNQRLQKDLRISDERMATLSSWSDANYMAESGDGEIGGQRLAAAVLGKSELGALSAAEKAVLVRQCAVKWMYSPSTGEEGALKNIKNFTEIMKAQKDPEIDRAIAIMFLQSTKQVRGQSFEGGNFDVLEKQRSIQLALRDFAIDIDPAASAYYVGGDSMAKIILGQGVIFPAAGSRLKLHPDLYGTKLPRPNEKSRLAIMNAVSRGALDEKQASAFFTRMYNSSSDWDVSPVDSIWGTKFDYDDSSEHEQLAMARLLTFVANTQSPQSEFTAEWNQDNFRKAMMDPGGREVLFSTMPDKNLRAWALDSMTMTTHDINKDPWMAEDLTEGWQSEVICNSFAQIAIEESRKELPEPLGFNAATDRGAMANTVGHLFGRPFDKGASKDKGAITSVFDSIAKPISASSPDKGVPRGEGFNRSSYDLEKDPMKQIMEKLGTGGDLQITAIPVSHMNREYGPALYKVLRVEKPGEPPYFIDHEGGSYKSVGDWLTDNDLPPGMVTFPGGLDLKNGPVTERTKNSGKVERGKVLLQSAAHKAAMVAGVLVVVGTGGAAAPLVGTVSGIIAVEGTIETLINKHDRGFDVTDLGNAQIRGLYFDIAANAFSLGAVGSTKLIKGLSKQGAQVSRAGANVIAGLTWAGNVTDAVQIMDQINNLANKWESLTPEQQDQELKSLGITLAMKTATIKKGGGKFRDEIDFIRLRSMIEHRCPYPVNNVDPDPKNPGRTIWVKNDGGKMTIEFVGKRPPQEMIDLHADAAGAMQASYTIVNRLKRKLGLGDSDQFPKGSVAWEASHEITKIGKEIDLNVRKMAGADQAARKKLIARQVELQAALIRENAKLEFFDQAGTGKVASPETGVDAAEARGWVTYQKGKKKGQKKEWLEEREKEGYSWVATDGEPHLYAPDKPPLYFNEYYGEFITKAKMAAIKESAGKIERSFDQDFHDDGAPVFDDNGALLKEIDYDKEINSVKGFPNLKGIKLTPETRATLMAEAFGRTVEQVGDIAQMMGSPLAKEHLSAWEQAIDASPPAQLALDEIRLKSKLADVAEQKGDHKRAIALRKQAGKLAGDAYNPVRSQFWKLVHSDPEFASLKAKIDDMGFTFEKGRAPYLEVPNPGDPNKPFEIGVTLEHFDRKSDYPLNAQNAEKLLFSFRYENVVILEHIRRIQRKRMGVNPGEKPNH